MSDTEIAIEAILSAIEQAKKKASRQYLSREMEAEVREVAIQTAERVLAVCQTPLLISHDRFRIDPILGEIQVVRWNRIGYWLYPVIEDELPPISCVKSFLGEAKYILTH